MQTAPQAKISYFALPCEEVWPRPRAKTKCNQVTTRWSWLSPWSTLAFLGSRLGHLLALGLLTRAFNDNLLSLGDLLALDNLLSLAFDDELQLAALLVATSPIRFFGCTPRPAPWRPSCPWRT